MNPINIGRRALSGMSRQFLLSALALACACLLNAVFPGIGQAAGTYQITNLGTIDSYGSKAYDLNDSGSVVGKLADATNSTVNGFFWRQEDGMRALAGLGGQTKAWGINNSGQIAGVSNNLAVLWSDQGATPQELGTLGGPTSFAYRINNNGQIVGWADKPDYSGLTVYHAFLYENGAMTDIGTLSADQNYYYGGYSLAYYANSSGRVVGVASTSNWGYHAFVWDSTNGMTDLGTNPNYPDHEGYATAINESGSLIAGCSKDANGNSYPMLWRNGLTTPELVPTPAAFPYAEFYDINEAGQLVGIMWDDAQDEHAFIYEAGKGFQDLNDLIPAGSGWELVFARSINEKGQIVGHGRFNGEDRAFLLTPPIPNDFNGDGSPDILWRNTSTGENAAWYMKGVIWIGDSYIWPVVSDQSWKIVGTGYFNGDGKPDILWRHSLTGYNAVWLMDGATWIGSDYLWTVPDPDWTIVGVSDLNNDGKSDILWRNTLTGENAIWFMDGVIIASGAYLITVPDQNWTIVGTGDFNNDGKLDILWRDSVAGTNAVWFMDGGNITGWDNLPAVPDQNWTIVGAADFNDDGKADILWRNTWTGENAVWFMNGIQLTGGQFLTAVPDQNWSIVGP